MQESEYFLILLVDARRLDYSGNTRFLRTLAKHPSDWSKNGDVGHAWIYLKGKDWVLEGGQTGEFGLAQPTYFEGVIDRCRKKDANPAAYLWETLYDGRFQRGPGGHKPTFAAKVDLTEEQFEAIKEYVRQYDFQEYSLTRRQCVTFVMSVARLAGLALEGEMTFSLDPLLRIGRYRYTLWNDAAYSRLTLCSPDRLEESLFKAVVESKAEYALGWYLSRHPLPSKCWETLMKFPRRIRFKLAL